MKSDPQNTLAGERLMRYFPVPVNLLHSQCLIRGQAQEPLQQ